MNCLKMKQIKNALAVFFVICLMTLPSAFCSAETRSEALSFLKTWRDQNNAELDKHTLEILAAIKSTTEIKLDKNEISDPTTLLNAKIAKLTLEKNEYKSRDELIDRLYFQVEQNYRSEAKTETGKMFLEEALLKMALQETKSTDPSALKLASFLTNSVVALKEIAEPTDPPFSFLKQYVEFSTLREPKNPSQFATQRHYSNGREAITSEPSTKEDAGAKAAELTDAPIIEKDTSEAWKQIAEETITLKPAEKSQNETPKTATPAKMSQKPSDVITN